MITYAHNDMLVTLVGVYGTGPIWGRIADSRGPRILFPVAFVFLLLGYSRIRALYDFGAPGSTVTVFALIICSFMTGMGGNAGLSGAINTTAKSFPDSAVRAIHLEPHSKL